jgi:hypothetical protein
MPTLKKRINLSVDKNLYKDLENLKKLKDAPSLSAIVIELTKVALDLNEDLYFSKIADERKLEKTISHKKLWKTK